MCTRVERASGLENIPKAPRASRLYTSSAPYFNISFPTIFKRFKLLRLR